jgi:hypothetical protein
MTEEGRKVIFSLPSEAHAWAACFLMAILYVANLYILVPTRVRQLDRENPRQVSERPSGEEPLEAAP